MSKKVGIVSLGCHKNLVDSENILGLFDRNNYEITNNPSEADIIVINTCGFIESSKQESINNIFEMLDYKKKVVVTGCLAERYYEALKEEIPEVLQRNFTLADDFFKERFLLKLDGTRTLVYKRRGADFYKAKKHVGDGFLWHIEIWNWHRAGEEWKLDIRDLPLRVKQKDASIRKLYGVKALEAIEPGTSIRLGKEQEYDFIRSLE